MLISHCVSEANAVRVRYKKSCHSSRYVTRAGRRLDYVQDSPPSPDEHLMIAFHNLLLLDDVRCISEAYEGRCARLHTLVCPVL